MDFMETFLFIVIIIGLFVINKNISSRFKHLEDTIDGLSTRIKLLQQRLKEQPRASAKSEFDVSSSKTEEFSNETIKETSTKSPLETQEDVIKETINEPEVKPIDFTDKKEPLVTPISEEKEIQEPIIETSSFSSTKDKYTTFTSKKEAEQFVPKKSWYVTFKENNPDLEKFIGENLINKIGILILVLGISFFVKFAIDKDWINEPARVGIGVLCGALIMAIAHKLKKNFAAFSSVLVAGAISIFYFTIFIAFHEYEVIESQTVAFVIMSLITAFSVLVSVSYNRQELAILSLIGGFATPFMVSTGDGNYVALFTYIAILNIGVLAVSYFKRWKIATILAFGFTCLLFLSWTVTELWADNLPHSGAIIFATLFYFIFSITFVISNLRNKGVFSGIDYFLLIANTFFFFGIGLTILRSWESNYTGLFTLALAIYNIIYASILYKKFGLDKNTIYLLIGLALTFITLTIPIQFEGNQITLFWAAEVVLLFWLSLKTKINSFKLGALIIQGLTLFSLFMDWERYWSYSEEFSIILNPLFLAGIVVSASLFLTTWILRNESEISTKFFSIDAKSYTGFILITGIIMTYFTGILETNYQAYQYITNQASALSFTVLYHFVFTAITLVIAFKFKQQILSKASLFISVASIFLYIVWFHKLPTSELSLNLINTTGYKYAFIFHYIILGCLVYFGFVLFKQIKTSFNFKSKLSKFLPWVFVFAIVFTLSNEIMIHGLQFSDAVVSKTEIAAKYPEVGKKIYLKSIFIDNNIDNAQTQIVKIGYPILWGIFAFIFLIIGIKKQWKTLRVIALSLLGITIVKLFVYDIKNVSETGKIVAFILLGVLILIISFVYQKIKKLVIDEEQKNEEL